MCPHLEHRMGRSASSRRMWLLQVGNPHDFLNTALRHGHTSLPRGQVLLESCGCADVHVVGGDHLNQALEESGVAIDRLVANRESYVASFPKTSLIDDARVRVPIEVTDAPAPSQQVSPGAVLAPCPAQ